MPSRLLYHGEYFRLRQALSTQQNVSDFVDERLRHILRVAIERVPYYRSIARISANDIANESPRELLASLPLLEKAEIMAQQKAFLDERLDFSKLNYATSGGSSGQGIGLWRTKRLADIEKAFFMHEWGKFGFSFDKSRYLRIGADARRQAHESPTRVIGNRLMLSPYHIAECFKHDIMAELNRYKPEFMHAYPSSASTLAELIDQGQMDFKLKAVLLASEPATDQQLSSIARVFGCPISVNYGLTERTNIAFATFQNGKLSPYIFNQLYGVSENRSVGGKMEIVGTSLWNDVMPLLRYCTDDFGVIDGNGHCASLEGRDQEFLVDRFGNRIPGLSIVIDEVTWDFVRLYQVRQKEPGRISIAIVPRGNALTEEQAAFVLNAQLRRWGSFFEVSLEEVKDIPLTSGAKRRLVVSEVIN